VVVEVGRKEGSLGSERERACGRKDGD